MTNTLFTQQPHSILVHKRILENYQSSQTSTTHQNSTTQLPTPPPQHPIAKPRKNKRLVVVQTTFSSTSNCSRISHWLMHIFFAYIHNKQYEVTPHPYPLKCIPRIEPDQIQGTILISNQYEANDMVPIVSHKVHFTSYSLMSICPWTKIHPQTLGHY